MTWYLLSCLGCCAVAAALAAKHGAALLAEARLYLRFLVIRWKLVVFLPALVFVTFGGRFTDDETWDVISGGGMSVLTFVTAPWAIGTLFKVLEGKRPGSYGVIAAALWLFSSSWFYDGYLLLRDGAYTPRWLGNLILSSMIYLCAGLLWNLEAASRWSGTMSFLRDDWPSPPDDRRFAPVLITAIPLAALAFLLLVGFVGWRL